MKMKTLLLCIGLSAAAASAARAQTYRFTNSAVFVWTQRVDLVAARVTPPTEQGGRFIVQFETRPQTNPAWARTLSTYLTTNNAKVKTNVNVGVTFDLDTVPRVTVTYAEIATNYSITEQAARAIDWYAVRTNALATARAKLLAAITNAP